MHSAAIPGRHRLLPKLSRTPAQHLFALLIDAVDRKVCDGGWSCFIYSRPYLMTTGPPVTRIRTRYYAHFFGDAVHSKSVGRTYQTVNATYIYPNDR